MHIQPGVRGQSLATLSAHSQPLSGHLPISCGTDFLGGGAKGGLPCLLTQTYLCLLTSLPHLGPPRPLPSPAVASPRSPLSLCPCLVLEEQNQVRSLLCSHPPVFSSLTRRRHSITMGREAATHLAFPLCLLFQPLWPLGCSQMC